MQPEEVLQKNRLQKYNQKLIIRRGFIIRGGFVGVGRDARGEASFYNLLRCVLKAVFDYCVKKF